MLILRNPKNSLHFGHLSLRPTFADFRQYQRAQDAGNLKLTQPRKRSSGNFQKNGGGNDEVGLTSKESPRDTKQICLSPWTTSRTSRREIDPQELDFVALKSRYQVSKLLRALDSQELADVTGTGLALGSFENKLSESSHEPHHVQTPCGVETRHHQLQPASSA